MIGYSNDSISPLTFFESEGPRPPKNPPSLAGIFFENKIPCRFFRKSPETRGAADIAYQIPNIRQNPKFRS